MRKKRRNMSHLCLFESSLYFSKKPFKGLRRQLVLLGHSSRAEDRAKECVEQQCRIFLCLTRDLIFPIHNDQLAAQFTHVCEEGGGGGRGEEEGRERREEGRGGRRGEEGRGGSSVRGSYTLHRCIR